jgi:hypothetical protein
MGQLRTTNKRHKRAIAARQSQRAAAEKSGEVSASPKETGQSA